MRRLFALVCLLGACGRTEVVAGFPDSFVGVGLELRVENGEPVVVRALPGGPADASGLTAGDVITAVNNVPMEGVTLGEAVMRLRGEPDTQVTLSVRRGADRLTVVVRRRTMAKTAGDYTPR